MQMTGAWGWRNTDADGYPQNIPSGTWYSFPAGGECHGRGGPSKGACSWTRQPVAKVVRGAALIAAGWNTSNSTSSPDYHSWSPSQEQVRHNAA